MGETLQDQVKKLLTNEGLLADAAKADKGNKSATTRVRQALMQLSKDAKALRAQIVPAGAE
ncbi:hypothetical protein [Zavarzinia sp.]|jgi:hypothetical protein|uniref:hypothetical protein n=1 Tax=Zavarzinia sp. TaxID=2027920 RepID=UPI003564B4AB